MTLTCVAGLPLVAAFRSHESPGGGRTVDTSVLTVPSHVVVEVTGGEFRWHFRYRQPDGLPTGDATSSNELRLPVGATVELHFTSDDYIYVFSVPELGIEQIAVPGLVTESACVTREPVTIDLLVDPLCSFRFYHDELMGRIIVQEQVR